MKVKELIKKLKETDQDIEVMVNGLNKTREIVDLSINYHPRAVTQVKVLNLKTRKI